MKFDSASNSRTIEIFKGNRENDLENSGTSRKVTNINWIDYGKLMDKNFFRGYLHTTRIHECVKTIFQID